jgi:hypothetical protein
LVRPLSHAAGNDKDAAKDKFAGAVKLTPHDAIAANLLKQEGGTVPAGNVGQPAESPSTERQANKSPGSLR